MYGIWVAAWIVMSVVLVRGDARVRLQRHVLDGRRRELVLEDVDGLGEAGVDVAACAA